MNEKPILFNGEMVRAILDGRKTKTRRVIKPQPTKNDVGWCWRVEEAKKPNCKPPFFASYPDEKRFGKDLSEHGLSLCPYGRPGDILWVRETWGYYGLLNGTRDGKEINEATVYYYADDTERAIGFDSFSEMVESAPKQNLKHPDGFDEMDEYDQSIVQGDLLRDWWQRQYKKPSIYMPRWASRITLRVTDVRVERVQDISEADAKAEGVTKDRPGGWISCESYQMLFHRLWDSINGQRGYGWDTNPWVWVVEFEVVR